MSNLIINPNDNTVSAHEVVVLNALLSHIDQQNTDIEADIPYFQLGVGYDWVDKLQAVSEEQLIDFVENYFFAPLISDFTLEKMQAIIKEARGIDIKRVKTNLDQGFNSKDGINSKSEFEILRDLQKFLHGDGTSFPLAAIDAISDSALVELYKSRPRTPEEWQDFTDAYIEVYELSEVQAQTLKDLITYAISYGVIQDETESGIPLKNIFDNNESVDVPETDNPETDALKQDKNERFPIASKVIGGITNFIGRVFPIIGKIF